MTGSARIGLAIALLLTGVSFAMAQYGPTTGGYPRGSQSPNPYGYYGYYGHYGDYDDYRDYAYRNCGRPRYALGTPYYVLGYPVPHYGYRPCWWR
jgi:hypothetical protein